MTNEFKIEDNDSITEIKVRNVGNANEYAQIQFVITQYKLDYTGHIKGNEKYLSFSIPSTKAEDFIEAVTKNSMGRA